MKRQLFLDVLKDINNCLDILRNEGLLLEENGVSSERISQTIRELTWSGKSHESSVVYDEHMSPVDILKHLLEMRQFTCVLFDRSIFQAEFLVSTSNDIVQARLYFLKKDNFTPDKDAFAEFEADYDPLRADILENVEGMPVLLRIDYNPSEYVEVDHPMSHLSISNAQSCRVPIKGVVLFSTFCSFILRHFYSIALEIKPSCDFCSTISELEKSYIHLNWE